MKIEGIYLHVPFCAERCPYCDFFSVVGGETFIQNYFAALRAEIKTYARTFDLGSVKTVYFGGGTPSFVEPALYEPVLKTLKELGVKPEEVTIEVNPADYGPREFEKLLKLGFNRISVGVQSFLDKNLKLLGRRHDAAAALAAVKKARSAGFENLSVDLIWALPNQTVEDLRREFELLAELEVSHLSAYQLTFYEKTPLWFALKRGEIKPPSEEEVEALYYALLEEVERLGFERYEISSFARSERFRSRHNLIYWRFKPYLGVGAGAHGFDGRRRWVNLKDLKSYAAAALAGKRPIASETEPSPLELEKERLILALRTVEGVPAAQVEKRLPPWMVKEFFTRRGENLAFNDRGFLVSNALLVKLLENF